MDKEGKEIEETEKNDQEKKEEDSKDFEPGVVKKKTLLSDENKEIAYGLQQPNKKARFIDRQNNSINSNTISAAKVLAREVKSGNKKLLSFYDEEQEEAEEFEHERVAEINRKQEEQDEDSD